MRYIKNYFKLLIFVLIASIVINLSSVTIPEEIEKFKNGFINFNFNTIPTVVLEATDNFQELQNEKDLNFVETVEYIFNNEVNKKDIAK